MITRRQFMILGASGVAVAAGSVVVLRTRGRKQPAPLPVAWRSVPIGALEPAELEVLIATVTALVDVKSTEHYKSMFVWRSENLPGDRGVYRAFTAEMHRRTPHYATADRKARLAALEDGVFLSRRKDSDLFYSHVVDLIFVKYSQSDAWIADGYDAWPGMPRGFVSYLQRAPGDR